MAKRDEPKKGSARGRSKAANRAGTQTAVNKARAAETRARRLLAAARRRASNEFVIPMDAMIPTKELPVKNYNALVEQCNAEGIAPPDFIPDPKRGTRLRRGPRLTQIIAKREDQARRIEAKRRQREIFSGLPAKTKREHREAGKAHKIPLDLA